MASSISCLPEVLLASILDRVVKGARYTPINSSYDFAVVCRSWFKEFLRLRAVRIPQSLAPTPDTVLVDELIGLPSVTSLHFTNASLHCLSDSFLLQLGEAVGAHLEDLIFSKRAAATVNVSPLGLDAFFSTVPNLSTLVLGSGGTQLSESQAGLVVPESISSLRNLTRLDLSRTFALPGNFGAGLSGLKKLAIQSLSLPVIPDSFSLLPSLTSLVLDLDVVETVPQSLSSLSSLTKLSLSLPSISWLPPEVFVLMQKLRKVSLCHVAVTELPPSMSRLHRLSSLKLDTEVVEAPSWLSCLTALRRLHLHPTTGPSVECLHCLPLLTSLHLNTRQGEEPHLPQSLDMLPELASLTLVDDFMGQRVRNLVAPLDSCGTLRRLVLVDFQGFEALEEDALRCLTSLRDLELVNCYCLASLPSSLGGMQELTRLTCQSSPYLSLLPSSLGDLTRLAELELVECEGLQCLPDSISGLVNLRVLALRDLEEMSSLPCQLSMLTALERVELVAMPELVGVPDCVGTCLMHLKSIRISGCNSLASLPDSVDGMTALTELSINTCPNLRRLPYHLAPLQSLRTLIVANCELLQCIPDSAGELSSLVQLSLSCLPSVPFLPDSMFRLTRLRTLSVHYEVLHLPGSLVLLPHLGTASRVALASTLRRTAAVTRVEITGQAGLETLSADLFSTLASARVLTVRGCPQLKELPEFLSLLEGTLRSLTVTWCGALRKLPESLGSLRSLTQLMVCQCNALETFPDSLGDLVSLSELRVSACAALTTLPPSMSQLEGLTRLEVTECPGIGALHEIAQLRELRVLILAGLPKLLKLPFRIGEAESLRELHLISCGILEGLPDSTAQLAHLREVVVLECPSFKRYPRALLRSTELSKATKETLWGLGLSITSDT